MKHTPNILKILTIAALSTTALTQNLASLTAAQQATATAVLTNMNTNCGNQYTHCTSCVGQAAGSSVTTVGNTQLCKTCQGMRNPMSVTQELNALMNYARAPGSSTGLSCKWNNEAWLLLMGLLITFILIVCGILLYMANRKARKAKKMAMYGPGGYGNQMGQMGGMGPPMVVEEVVEYYDGSPAYGSNMGKPPGYF